MNTFGNKFKVSIFGESHGPRTGVVIDGVPAGMLLTEEDLIIDIDRRRAGAKGTTGRREEDVPHIESGLFEGHTTGAPLTVTFDNADTRSGDYGAFTDVPRPGHADFTASRRFGGWNDPRGGGHFSGRLTLPVVAAGAVARKCLREKFPDVVLAAHICELGGIPAECESADVLPAAWIGALDAAAAEGDSLGAVVKCSITLPAGVGEPFWDGIESVISHAVFAIPGVRGIEFGDGFAASRMKGSEHNDPFGKDGKPARNGSGGVNGGISNGAALEFKVAFKPTSSISKSQRTLNFSTGEMETLRCGGRHDVCFALRCPVIVEAMGAIALMNLI